MPASPRTSIWMPSWMESSYSSRSVIVCSLPNEAFQDVAGDARDVGVDQHRRRPDDRAGGKDSAPAGYLVVRHLGAAAVRVEPLRQQPGARRRLGMDLVRLVARR